MKKRFLTTALFLTLCTLSLTACGNTENAASSAAIIPSGNTGAATANTITVNSSEQIKVIPDMAAVVYAVRTEAKDAASCQSSNSEAVNQVVEQLKGLGVSETSIQTSGYDMSPIYNYSNNTRRLTGYEASSTLTVSDLPIADLGKVLAESVTAGINDVQSVSYSFSNYDESYQEALKLAVASAKAKAEALAEAGGCTLGSVVRITENSGYTEARYTNQSIRMSSMKEESLSDTNVNIMPGELDVEVQISVEYEIK